MAFAERDVETRIVALLRASSRVSLRTWQLGLLVAAGVMALALLVGPLHHGSEWVIDVLSEPAAHLH
jgi:hypothetical protein